MLKKTGIDKKINLRHTYATNLPNAGAELVDIKAPLGHESVATTQIYTHVGQARMEKLHIAFRYDLQTQAGERSSIVGDARQVDAPRNSWVGRTLRV